MITRIVTGAPHGLTANLACARRVCKRVLLCAHLGMTVCGEHVVRNVVCLHVEHQHVHAGRHLQSACLGRVTFECRRATRVG
jgi:hypothetical protein